MFSYNLSTPLTTLAKGALDLFWPCFKKLWVLTVLMFALKISWQWTEFHLYSVLSISLMRIVVVLLFLYLWAVGLHIAHRVSTDQGVSWKTYFQLKWSRLFKFYFSFIFIVILMLFFLYLFSGIYAGLLHIIHYPEIVMVVSMLMLFTFIFVGLASSYWSLPSMILMDIPLFSGFKYAYQCGVDNLKSGMLPYTCMAFIWMVTLRASRHGHFLMHYHVYYLITLLVFLGVVPFWFAFDCMVIKQFQKDYPIV